jgi:hypothetical protein
LGAECVKCRVFFIPLFLLISSSSSIAEKVFPQPPREGAQMMMIGILIGIYIGGTFLNTDFTQ